jgi:hypothetical protein
MAAYGSFNGLPLKNETDFFKKIGQKFAHPADIANPSHPAEQ